MADDAEEIPGRPVFSVGAREGFKTRGGSLSSEGANAAQAERSTLIEILRSPKYSDALILNAIITLSFVTVVHFMVNAIPAYCNF
jgi:hypothetical protein